MFKSYLFRNSDPSIDMILCMTSFLLSCHHQRNSDTPKAANYTKPLCTLCPIRALEPWIRRFEFTIFTGLVQRNGEVKIQYRKAQAQRRSLAQPPPELGMALLRTVLSIFSREKTASTCMQLLTCTRTNPARNNLSCNREYRRLRAFPIWGIHIQTKSTFICGFNGVGGGGGVGSRETSSKTNRLEGPH